MSREITYRKAVVKLPDGRTLPILESGSNNCWECDRNRRSRSRGVMAKLIGTKESITPRVKTRVQRIINDKEYTERDDSNRQQMDSQYRASWRFPGNLNLGQVITYLTNANIDLDIADKCITINGVKPSEIDTLPTQARYENIQGVEYAIREQKDRNNMNKKPRKEKVPGDYVIKVAGSGYYTGHFIYKLSSRTVKFSGYPGSSKRFDSENQAEKRIVKHNLCNRFSGSCKQLEVLSLKKLADVS